MQQTIRNTRDFEIMLKNVPIDGIGLSCVALAARDFGTWQCCRAQVQV
jgi:hypothetical protein